MRLPFDNAFRRDLPGDPETGNYTRPVSGALWSAVQPAPVPAPRLLALSPEVAAAIGLSREDTASSRFAQVFAGNALIDGMQPIATNYGGHQFGHWAGQLGDGRAISLGEVIGADGRRHELQLKGAGPTPYSRRADGRAVLRSSLREFLCSEAMHALGVPTTRALSLIATGDAVVRDILYAGDPKPEPGAIVCRVAPSFLRFGHFELPASRGEHALLRQLWDFMCARDFPEYEAAAERDAQVFRAICERTALLIAHWMRVGFVHGVMNTDNLSVLGLTIDYGPYGWLEDFDPAWTPNTTDAEGRRYAFGRQPQIAHWNLSCLAGALSSLFADQEPLREGLRAYAETFNRAHAEFNAGKLGLLEPRTDDTVLAQRLYALMHAAQLDFTLGFRALMDFEAPAASVDRLRPASYDEAAFEAQRPALLAWCVDYAQRLAGEGASEARRARMAAVNPLYVPRNWLAQQAIDAAEGGDLAPLHQLQAVLERPYEEQPGAEAYAHKRPDWARHRAGCSMLSCSS
ncbi:YdiU family protein [uncultured Aquimonas sp.]|uniref:protein adenylyltransferase SelO n=1 Tax=uncultured Aquimonas sp. TaxID=385483 RepID=UPI00086849F1|nr:YdiU family protein [uncultured Aquimonas sp.]ODU43346.1 MAG: hypothetical protein ABS96_23250 [Xanthomonadaceae bacterium SCN 69-123]